MKRKRKSGTTLSLPCNHAPSHDPLSTGNERGARPVVPVIFGALLGLVTLWYPTDIMAKNIDPAGTAASASVPASEDRRSARWALSSGATRPLMDIRQLLAVAPEKPDAAAPVPSQGGQWSEKIRKAGELALEGDYERAHELVNQLMRECESSDTDVRECAQWEKSLRGLEVALRRPPAQKSFTNSIGMKLVRIPAGDYMMGSLKQEMDWIRLTFKKTWRDGHKQWFQDELPLHPVRITRSFYMGATEVTVGQFREFVRETGFKSDAEKGEGGMIWNDKEYRWSPDKKMKWDSLPWRIEDNQPVVFASWNDAQAFCRWLSRKEKRTYRLPTEAEWEMACRGGRAWVRFPWGNRLPGDGDANFGDGNPKLPESMTTVNDGYKYVAPVGSYPPNGFGLYDMDGNVMEWAQDNYDRNYYESSPLEDPQGPSRGTSKVNKGGNWFSSPTDCRCAFRGFSGPEMNFWNMGFRVVMDDDESGSILAGGGDGKARGSSKKAADSAFPPTQEDGIRLFRQAMFAAQQQQWDDAIADLESALKVYEKRDDPMWIPRVKATLAGIYAERNRRYKSKELYTEALQGFRKIGDTASAGILLARLQELETSPGVRVAEVKKGSLAERAGVVKGDMIVEYGGETGFRVSGFKKLVDDFSRSDKVTLTVMNDGRLTTTVVPGGSLGVAIEDVKRPPRPRRPQEQVRGRNDREEQTRPRRRTRNTRDRR